MTVLLRHGGDLPPTETCVKWMRIGTATDHLDPARIERSFDAVATSWLELGQRLGGSASAILAHAPACTTNVSDLGVMKAWSLIVQEEAAKPDPCLVVCDDPWMFRHLSRIAGVEAESPPPLFFVETKLFLRGFLARLKCVFSLLRKSIALRGQKKHAIPGARVLLVYGHPASTAEGHDAYFGALMKNMPDLRRVLHVDCGIDRAFELEAGGRTLSLHAWGRLREIPGLLFARWRPDPEHLTGADGWLVRRAARKEGSTAQGAMIAWQQKCQRRWLTETRPLVVAWPWENHSWERDFVRAARAADARTIGYQHSVIGHQMLNYSPASNPDGLASLPDLVLCSGPATREQLLKWGLPKQCLKTSGALRTILPKALQANPDGPVFIALPFDGETARQMVTAARTLIGSGFRFLVKDHPMSPYHFAPAEGIERTDRPFFEHQGLRAVLYASTTVGLEAALAGLPTIRFRPGGRLALDILPDEVDLPVADPGNLLQVLVGARPPTINRERIFPPARMDFWKRTMAHDRPIS